MLERLQREMREVQKAVNSLDTELARISFIPGDPEASSEQCARRKRLSTKRPTSIPPTQL